MPVIEEIHPEPVATGLSPKLANSYLVADEDSEGEDEFHDAEDRVSDGGDEGAGLKGEAEEFTEEEILDLLSKAEASKSTGNKLYVEDRWEEAKGHYAHGLTCVPKRKPSPASASPPNGRDDALDDPAPSSPTTEGQAAPAPTPAVQEQPAPELTELEKRSASLRAQLNCNLGACCVKLNDHEGAVKFCTEALIDDPKYVKALQRRAASNEVIGTWSALTLAETDYTTLLSVLPVKDQMATRRALARIKPRVEEAKQKETAEMIGKLKDLGNSLLGRFGLSTDNFQFTPNGQGGYGMNFVR